MSKFDIANLDTDQALDLYSEVVEFLPIGIYFLDMKGKFIYGNKMAESIVGYDMKDMVGKHFKDAGLLQLKDIPKAIKFFSLAILGKDIPPETYDLNRADGEIVYITINANLIKVGGKKAIIGLVQDFTAKKQKEDEIKEKIEELERIHNLMAGRDKRYEELVSGIGEIEDKLEKS